MSNLKNTGFLKSQNNMDLHLERAAEAERPLYGTITSIREDGKASVTWKSKVGAPIGNDGEIRLGRIYIACKESDSTLVFSPTKDIPQFVRNATTSEFKIGSKLLFLYVFTQVGGSQNLNNFLFVVKD